jgi:hypothetical protein
MRKKLFVLVVLTLIASGNGHVHAAEQDSPFPTALKLVEITFNKEAIYKQFIYYGILPVKERFENNPKTKEYSEILVGVAKEVLDEYFNDPETQRKLKVAYASIYSEEFTEKELVEMIEFYKTETGKKVLQKLPVVMEKGRYKEVELANGSWFSKYEQMFVDKLGKLQDDGLIPKKF